MGPGGSFYPDQRRYNEAQCEFMMSPEMSGYPRMVQQHTMDMSMVSENGEFRNMLKIVFERRLQAHQMYRSQGLFIA